MVPGRRTARLLTPLERRGWRVLHDRAVPGSSIGLDHLVVGPAGVCAINSKAWIPGRDRLELRGGTLWFGRDSQARLLEAVAWQADVVAVALGVPVRAVVAVHGTKVPGGVVQLDEVTVLPVSMLRRHLRGLLPLQAMDDYRVQRLAERAEQVLPPR
ncbi:nuclease-related domain-containing protein [Peterkaempfera sp. SMS 1(5)a]|uniref:nuclease-related domain-containing protein n=1 Tax=Peterkaempfera podocarpi TaxID=3232308 RepID=UPI00366CE20F